MKKNFILGMLLAASLAFKAHAGGWLDAQEICLDVQNWFLSASKPLKPKW